MKSSFPPGYWHTRDLVNQDAADEGMDDWGAVYDKIKWIAGVEKVVTRLALVFFPNATVSFRLIYWSNLQFWKGYKVSIASSAFVD